MTMTGCIKEVHRHNLFCTGGIISRYMCRACKFSQCQMND